ncbi:MAG: four helix bundle protein [Patescibacteria group bacterium]
MKYSLGEKIDNFFVETLEGACAAAFAQKDEKLLYVQRAIQKLDMGKIFLQIAWEIKSLDTAKYATLSEKLDSAGKQLGGWYGQLIKQNSPAK